MPLESVLDRMVSWWRSICGLPPSWRTGGPGQRECWRCRRSLRAFDFPREPARRRIKARLESAEMPPDVAFDRVQGESRRCRRSLPAVDASRGPTRRQIDEQLESAQMRLDRVLDRAKERRDSRASRHLPFVVANGGSDATVEPGHDRVSELGWCAQGRGAQAGERSVERRAHGAASACGALSAAHHVALGSRSAEPATDASTSCRARCARLRSLPPRLAPRALRGVEQPSAPDLRSRRRARARAWHAGSVRSHRAGAQPHLAPRGLRVRGSLPRARAEDAARGAQRAEVPVPECAAPWDPLRRTGSVLVRRVVRRLACLGDARDLDGIEPVAGDVGISDCSTGGIASGTRVTTAACSHLAAHAGMAQARTDRSVTGRARVEGEAIDASEGLAAIPRRVEARVVHFAGR